MWSPKRRNTDLVEQANSFYLNNNWILNEGGRLTSLDEVKSSSKEGKSLNGIWIF